MITSVLPHIHELIGLSFPMHEHCVSYYQCRRCLLLSTSIAVGVVFLYCTVMWSYTVQCSNTILYFTLVIWSCTVQCSYMILYCMVQLYDLVLYSTVIWGIPTVHVQGLVLSVCNRMLYIETDFWSFRSCKTLMILLGSPPGRWV